MGNEPLEVPDEVLERLQRIVDLLARIAGAPAGLIMRLRQEDIEVFVASHTDGNPYEVGASEHFAGSGLYCETVIRANRKLLVPNAVEDEHWKDNPDVKLNMVSYLGMPLRLPGGRAFGTICILDSKSNGYSQDIEELMEQLRDLVESNLALAQANAVLGEENKRLQDYVEEIQTLRGTLPICMHCKNIRDDEGFWRVVEEYVESHSTAQFTHGICPECLRKHYPEYADK